MAKVNEKNQNFKARKSLAIQKLADKEAPMHWYSAEFKIIIFSLVTLRIITALFSITTGYFSVSKFIGSFLNSFILTIILSFGFLIGLEYLSNDFVFRVSKYQIKKEKSLLLVFLPFALFFVSISGFVSFQGIKQIVQKGTIKSAKIELQKRNVLDSLKNERDRQVAYYKQMIQIIRANPRGWKNGRPSQLTLVQQKQINDYNQKIDSINRVFTGFILQAQKDFAKKKLETLQKAQKKGFRFGWLIIGIQIFNIIITWLFAYLLDLTYLQNNKKAYRSEVLTSIKTQLARKYNKSYINAVQDFGNSVISEFDYNNYNITASDIEPNEFDSLAQKTEVTSQKTQNLNNIEQARVEQDKELKTLETQRKNTKINNSGPFGKPDNSQTNLSYTLNAHNLHSNSNLSAEQKRILLKHANLVRAIFRNKDLDNPAITNQEIREIQSNCRACKWKSRATIQRVWEVVQGAGFQNVKDFLNIKNGVKHSKTISK